MRHYSLIKKLLTLSSLVTSTSMTDGFSFHLPGISELPSSSSSSSSTTTTAATTTHRSTGAGTSTGTSTRGRLLQMTLLAAAGTPTTKITTRNEPNERNNEAMTTKKTSTTTKTKENHACYSTRNRRHALHSILISLTGIGSVGFVTENHHSPLSTGIVANALDMDAFMNSQLEADTKNCNPKLDTKCVPKLTADEAMCQYGQSGGTAKIEACRRLKAAGISIPQPDPKVKSLGGAYAM